MKRNFKRDQQPAQPPEGYYQTHPSFETFTCGWCGKEVGPAGAGSDHRNHCPNCLHSRHVDNTPGDRAAHCGGDMEPIAVWVRDGGEWALIHRCKKCGKLSSNRVLADDNPVELLSSAVKPLAQPPFPPERVRQLQELLAGEPTGES